MSKGWDVLFKTDLASIGVLRDFGLRVRLEVKGASVLVFVNEYSPDEPEPGFTGSVSSLHSVKHVDMVLRSVPLAECAEGGAAAEVDHAGVIHDQAEVRTLLG